MKARSQNYNKLKKIFIEDSLQFHQQKSASRFTREFVGRPAYSYKDHSYYTIHQGLNNVLASGCSFWLA